MSAMQDSKQIVLRSIWYINQHWYITISYYCTCVTKCTVKPIFKRNHHSLLNLKISLKDSSIDYGVLVYSEDYNVSKIFLEIVKRMLVVSKDCTLVATEILICH